MVLGAAQYYIIYNLLPLATASTITQLIYPFFTDRTPVAIFDLPRMLTIHLKMDINFSWYYIIVNIALIFMIAIAMVFNRSIFTICVHNIRGATMLYLLIFAVSAISVIHIDNIKTRLYLLDIAAFICISFCVFGIIFNY